MAEHDDRSQPDARPGYFQVLAEAVDGLPGARELAAIFQSAGEKGAVLTERLLSFARRDNDDPQQLRPDEVLAGMWLMLKTTLRDNVTLAFDLSCPDAVVVTDPTDFETAILNLVLNARDAMPDGGTLTIATALVAGAPPPAEHVEIAVRDTGTGMTPEVCDRAFAPLFTTKAKGGRFGIGPEHGVWFCAPRPRPGLAPLPARRRHRSAALPADSRWRR